MGVRFECGRLHCSDRGAVREVVDVIIGLVVVVLGNDQ